MDDAAKLNDPEYAEAAKALAIAQRRYDETVSKLGQAEQIAFKKLTFVMFDDRVALHNTELKPLVDEVNEARKVLDAVKAKVAVIRKAALARQAAAWKAAEDAAISKLFGGK